MAPGNSIQNIGNLLKPALLISLLIVSRRTEREEGASPSFEERREPVIATAGMATAIVGTAFGIGFALELTVPAMLIAAVLAAVLAARRAAIGASGGWGNA